MTTKQYVWREVSLERPYEIDTLHNILIHLASLTSRGPVVWETRAQGGIIRYRLGTLGWSMGRVREVLSAHANVQLREYGQITPVTSVSNVKFTRSGLPLNTDIAEAMIRATLTALVNGSEDHECVVQVILGKSHAPKLLPKHVADPSGNWVQAVLGGVHDATA